jgi:exopolysaccharide biosynthesis polyprenyl glycosylphosphotransferase
MASGADSSSRAGSETEREKAQMRGRQAEETEVSHAAEIPAQPVPRAGDRRVGASFPGPSGDAPLLRRWQRRLIWTAVMVDVLVVAVTIWPLLAANVFHLNSRPSSLGLALLLPLAWVLSLALGRAYEPQVLGVGAEEFGRLGVSAMGLIMGISLFSFVFRMDVSRGLVVAALPCTLALDLLARYVLRKRLHRRRRAGECMRGTLLVGPVPWVDDLVERLRRSPHVGLQAVGCCLPVVRPASLRLPGPRLPVCGDYTDILAAVRRTGATVVAVAPSERMDSGMLRQLAWDLADHDAEIIVAPNLIDCVGPRIRIRPVDGLPLLEIERPRFSGGHRVLKNAVDRLFALVVLVLLAPFLVAIAVAVRRTSSGPALFRQRRIGANGREFWLLKFRTMYDEQKWVVLRNDCADGPLFKMRGDPRVTPLGRRLRRYSLDELPQLVNVLRGDMSLIGPRPPLPHEVSQYDAQVRRRLLVRPGLTGLWQVSGRSDLTWEESVRLDLFYVENWSLALDAMILWKTVPTVLSGKGAY